MSATPPPPLLTLPSAPFAILRRLEWHLRGASEGVLAGEYRSAFRGRGIEFDQVVKYAFGDDVRDIDWNVTARLGEPYRKRFIEEREVTVLLVFEDTPSLQFGSGMRTKREALLELAGLLLLLGAMNRDRSGFIRTTPAGVAECIPPTRGRGALHHAAARLLSSPPPPITAGTQTAIPWAHLRRLAPRHSILVWLNDFPPRPVPAEWSAARSHFHTLGFRIDDPWERSLPPEIESFPAYDPIAGRLIYVENNAASRAAHARWREEREASWQSLFPSTTRRLVASTNDILLDALVRFFSKK
ncbi:MAG: DUF58 domain-containing protein [Puniceicoccales bacterium]|jgi:uncharacterized protein (DUF58 family)|nr:DUF58 domain-containing protein [Puniceicoccales bacterium]